MLNVRTLCSLCSVFLLIGYCSAAPTASLNPQNIKVLTEGGPGTETETFDVVFEVDASEATADFFFDPSVLTLAGLPVDIILTTPGSSTVTINHVNGVASTVTTSGYSLTANPLSGIGTFVITAQQSYFSPSVGFGTAVGTGLSVVSVPEPSSAAFFAATVCVFGLRRRRRSA